MTRREWLGAAAAATTLMLDRVPNRDAASITDRDDASPAISSLAASLCVGAQTPDERALRVYAFVRDEIAFGFTPHFDLATPTQTLAARRGHCNPQAALFIALLRAAGIDARAHIVTIRADLLDGLAPGTPLRGVDHTFTEVRLNDAWQRVDGYILDTPFHLAARQRLRREGRRRAYGAHCDGRIDWDARGDCMSQFVESDMLLVDHGVHHEVRAHFASPRAVNRLGVVGGLAYRWLFMPRANATIDALRRASDSHEWARRERL